MMKKKYFQISLYILVPFTFSGLSLLWVILTSQLASYYGTSPAHRSSFILWEIGVVVITFLIGLIITWIMLRPVSKFIKKAASLPVFPKATPEEETTEKDSLEHFTRVFEQITNILSKVEAKELFPGIIGQSRIMRGIFTQIIKVAPTDSTVLILGESGSGKELVATSLYEHSLRRGGPFIKINCVAIPESLLESELFGHERGAFTGATSQKIGKFEAADGGTIFLDEIGDMPLNTQAKILRVLQEKEFERVGGTGTIKVDVRFIVATNKNLQEMIRQGLFREDLYYRINVFSIYLPPLRERKEDIPYLVDHFLNHNVKPVTLSPQALQAVIGYSWPGNIRELQNTIERAAVLTETGVIEPAHLPAHILGTMNGDISHKAVDTFTIDERLDDIEKGLIIEALNRTGGVQVRAAELLGINQRSLWHRIKKHGIDIESFKNLQKM
ncbi:MAG: sigma-54-dependent Fis family transcriptional regulator [Deltaproteobacteria bacterium]|nr:sigma-54-dependent Fis family transcriptional regulator [Deltaproteobacteria bacterium]